MRLVDAGLGQRADRRQRGEREREQSDGQRRSSPAMGLPPPWHTRRRGGEDEGHERDHRDLPVPVDAGVSQPDGDHGATAAAAAAGSGA